MLLLVDYREKWFIQKLKELFPDTPFENEQVHEIVIEKNCTRFKITNLNVGDFIYMDDNEDNQTDKEHSIILAVERKSIRDLCASITDGRFREQKVRLQSSIPESHKIMFVIEGGKKKCHASSLSQVIIDSSILNMMFKHNFKVLFTDNEIDTFNNLMLMYKKLVNGDFDTLNNNRVPPTKLTSKKTSIETNLFALQLSVIPGVSFSTSQKIVQEYKTMKALVNAFDNYRETDAELLLSKIQISEKRKLGAALSKKIYFAVCKN